MHPESVKTIFRRLYSSWGDTDKKLVLAESWGHDYFYRKQAMLVDIRSAGFAVNRINISVTIFRPNKSSAAAQSIESIKRASLVARIKRKINKRVTNLIVRTLSTQIGQQLAKLIKRGPIHQNKVTSAMDAITQPLFDFFENLVADERTPDEIFMKPRLEDIKY